MKPILLALALTAYARLAHADTLIIPTLPGTSLLDYSQHGMRVDDGVIYETYPDPLGIINPMGTTYREEGDMLVRTRGF